MMIAELTPRSIEFPAPAPLMNMNDRAHWSTQRAHARRWRMSARLYALDTLGVGTSLPPSIVTVHLPVLGNRRRDPHNYFLTVKHVVDGLVDAGLWPDDTPEWVTTTEPVLVPHPAKTLRRPVRIIITPRTAS
jgi:crossover junction endodeoxyribonuclease RusA